MNVVNTNVQSLNSQRALGGAQSSLATSMERLSSGLRINSAKDDAAGLAISERMKAQSSGMDVATRNAADGISLAQTAEGALGEVGEMLGRMRDLTVQAANGTNSTKDKENLNAEFAALSAEITRTFETTKFNGTAMFDGGSTTSLQVGANGTAGDKVAVVTSDLKANVGDVFSTVNISTASTDAVLGQIDTAIDAVTTERSSLGSVMNRLEHTIGNLQNSIENTEASKSRITDADFAKEAANMSRSQVLQQAATSMLSQANAAPQAVLALIR